MAEHHTNFVRSLLAAGMLGGALLGGAAAGRAQGVAAAPTPGVAQELGRAFAEHETALATAHAAENRRYQTALSALATRAKQSGDADALSAAQQTLVTLATQPAPPSAESLAAMGPYVGGWDCVTPWGFRSSFLLQPDGSFNGYGARQGTWTVENNQLTLRAQDWSDVYNLPARNGVLKGHTADGAHDGMQLTRRGMGPAASLEAGLVGKWELMLDNNGDPTQFTFAPDGSMVDSRHLVGSWAVVGNELVVTFEAHHDWIDTYELPVGPGGVTNGHNPFGGKLALTRKGQRTATGMAGVAGSATGTVRRGGGGGASGSFFGTALPATESVTPTPRR